MMTYPILFETYVNSILTELNLFLSHFHFQFYLGIRQTQEFFFHFSHKFGLFILYEEIIL